LHKPDGEVAAYMKANRGISFNTADPKQLKKINAIAKVGAELFSTKGYLETSMDDIAAAANITKGAVYHYFASKAEILFLICSTYVDLDLVGLEQSLQAMENAEKIEFIVLHHIEHFAGHVYAAGTLLHESYNLPPKYLKEVRSRERKYYEIVAKVISDFLGEGARKEVVTTLTFTLFGMLNWIYKWYSPKEEIKPKELSRMIYEIFTSGLKSSPTVMEMLQRSVGKAVAPAKNHRD
jgi:AcrR family transcriptional regulator